MKGRRLCNPAAFDMVGVLFASEGRAVGRKVRRGNEAAFGSLLIVTVNLVGVSGFESRDEGQYASCVANATACNTITPIFCQQRHTAMASYCTRA